MDLDSTIKAIQEVYLSDSRPWVIGYSGGKDSTCTLQLVWEAISAIPGAARKKQVYVLSSDTLVESPVIARYISENIAAINRAAKSMAIPLTASIVTPVVGESFWVNLIGRGYPAPYSKFRWCTDRLKISPANRFIKEQVARFGEVVLVLGVRKAESATRAQVMATHEIEGSSLRSHSTLNGALVFAPISDWSTNDVWAFLLQNASTPWKSDNNDLAAIYKSADGECPLVVDTTTPSCGNSRFGCWVCTVVTRDKSMEAMVDAGQYWMEELLSIRDFLAETQLPERKKEVRTIRKTDGRILLKDSGSEAALGPYTLDFCREVLTRLLTVQKSLPPEAENFELISDAELIEIRRLWKNERNDWQDSLPTIYREVFAKEWISVGDGPHLLDLDLVQDIAREYDLPSPLLKRLLDVERRSHGQKRRANILNDIKSVLEEDWRSDAEVASDIKALNR